MSEIVLVTLSSIKNNLKLKTVAIAFAGVTLICALGLILAMSLILIAPETEKAAPDLSLLELYLGVVLYAVSLICVGVYMNSFAFQSMTREKSRGNIDALLATPLRVKSVWIAKSLAVFLPGFIVGVIVTVITLVALNYLYFVPLNGFQANPWMLVSSLVGVPLIYLFLSLLVHLVGLTGRPSSGNVIVQIFLPVFTAMMINLMVRSVLDPGSWLFLVINLGIAALIGVIVLVLRPGVTAEKMVLSARS